MDTESLLTGFLPATKININMLKLDLLESKFGVTSISKLVDYTPKHFR